MTLTDISYYTANVLLALGLICFAVLIGLMVRELIIRHGEQVVHRTLPPALPTESLGGRPRDPGEQEP